MRVLLIVLALLVGSSASAQTPEVPRGTAFKIAADHDGLDTTSYRLWRNGAIVENKLASALAAGVITFDQPATLAGGSYTYEVSAVGPGGETRSAPFLVTVKIPAPAPPMNLRYVAVLIAEDGTITFKLVAGQE